MGNVCVCGGGGVCFLGGGQEEGGEGYSLVLAAIITAEVRHEYGY